jgi:hypothetical protein
MENKKKAYGDQQQFLIDREKYAQQNAKYQKWGDAFKSLVDLAGGIGGIRSYVDKRGENPYLQQAFKEMQDIPRERFKNQNDYDNFLLDYYMGEDAKVENQRRFEAQQQQQMEIARMNDEIKKEQQNIEQWKIQLQYGNEDAKRKIEEAKLNIQRLQTNINQKKYELDLEKYNNPKDTPSNKTTAITFTDGNGKTHTVNLNDGAIASLLGKGTHDLDIVGEPILNRFGYPTGEYKRFTGTTATQNRDVADYLNKIAKTKVTDNEISEFINTINSYNNAQGYKPTSPPNQNPMSFVKDDDTKNLTDYANKYFKGLSIYESATDEDKTTINNEIKAIIKEAKDNGLSIKAAETEIKKFLDSIKV